MSDLTIAFTTPCREDGDWATKWGPAGKTAKMKAAQDCFNRGFYDARIVDCGPWKFKAECTNPVPEGWSKPYSNESAQEEGFGDRNAAADANCRSKGYGGSNPNDWRDRGEWFYSIKCINPLPSQPSQPQPQPSQPQPSQPQPSQPQPQPVPYDLVHNKEASKSNTGLIIGIIVGVLLLLVIVIVIVVVVMRGRKPSASVEYETGKNVMYPDLVSSY